MLFKLPILQLQALISLKAYFQTLNGGSDDHGKHGRLTLEEQIT